MRVFLGGIVLVALAAGMASGQESVDLEKETGLLMGNEKLFVDYCMASRAYIVDDVSRRARETSSALFNVFFGATTEIGEEILEVERKAVEELSRSMVAEQKTSSAAQAGSASEDGPLEEEKIRQLIEEGKEMLRKSSGSNAVTGALHRLLASTMTAGQVMISTANSALFLRLAKLREQLSGPNFVKGIANTCQQVAAYEQQLEQDLAEAKVALKGENSEAEVQAFIDQMTLNKLNCDTSKFIARLSAFCGILKTGSLPFFKMLGISPSIAETIKEVTQA